MILSAYQLRMCAYIFFGIAVLISLACFETSLSHQPTPVVPIVTGAAPPKPGNAAGGGGVSASGFAHQQI